MEAAPIAQLTAVRLADSSAGQQALGEALPAVLIVSQSLCSCSWPSTCSSAAVALQSHQPSFLSLLQQRSRCSCSC